MATQTIVASLPGSIGIRNPLQHESDAPAADCAQWAVPQRPQLLFETTLEPSGIYGAGSMGGPSGLGGDDNGVRPSTPRVRQTVRNPGGRTKVSPSTKNEATPGRLGTSTSAAPAPRFGTRTRS